MSKVSPTRGCGPTARAGIRQRVERPSRGYSPSEPPTLRRAPRDRPARRL